MGVKTGCLGREVLEVFGREELRASEKSEWEVVYCSFPEYSCRVECALCRFASNEPALVLFCPLAVCSGEPGARCISSADISVDS